METTKHHQNQADKRGADHPLGYSGPVADGLRHSINVSRVATANRMSTFVQPSDLDAFINGFQTR